MKTISLSEVEYFALQQKIDDLEKKVALLQDEQFIQKLFWAYQVFIMPKSFNYNDLPIQKVSIKRGSGKNLITYIADDFTATLDDFKEYM